MGPCWCVFCRTFLAVWRPLSVLSALRGMGGSWSDGQSPACDIWLITYQSVERACNKTNVWGKNERQKLGTLSFFLFCDCWGPLHMAISYPHKAFWLRNPGICLAAFHMQMNMSVPNSVLKEEGKGSPGLSVLGPALDQVSIWVLPGAHMVGESL